MQTGAGLLSGRWQTGMKERTAAVRRKRKRRSPPKQPSGSALRRPGRGQRMGPQMNARTFPAVSAGSYLTCVAHLAADSVQCSRGYLKSSAQQDLTAAIGVVRPKSESSSVILVQMVPGGAVGIAGQIKLVHAEHFMCHRNFDVEFG